MSTFQYLPAILYVNCINQFGKTKSTSITTLFHVLLETEINNIMPVVKYIIYLLIIFGSRLPY